ncbi:MAG: T9SS type A sorting domain-containing protein [Bacteroidia bacterium]
MPNPDGSANVTNSRCGVYAAVTYTEINGCLFDTVDYGIDEQYLDIGLQSYLTANTINAYNYGIRLMENDGCDNINVEYNDITLLNKEKSAIGIYAGESNLHHTTSYIINGNSVRLLNATAGIQTAGVCNAQITFNTIELQKPLTYTAPTTTGIDLGGGGGNFLSCNHVAGHTATDTLRYGYRVTQSPFDSLKCNVADSVGYSFRFEGAACVGTRLKGNYMGNAYCGLYLNTEAIIGKQPDSSIQLYHGNIWLNALKYTSGFGAVNLNDANIQSLRSSLFTTNITVAAHNPTIPLSNLSSPFYVDNNGWFDPQNSGANFDCSRSNVCIAAIQGSGDWGDDQLRMRVISDSSISSLFIPESKQIASQLIYADLKTDPNAGSISAYSDYLDDKEYSSEGIMYQIDSVGEEIKLSLANRSVEVSGLLDQFKVLSDSIASIDSLNIILNDTSLVQLKENILGRIEEIKMELNEIQESYILDLNSKQIIKEQLNESISPQQVPDANSKEVESIKLLFKQSGLPAISSNFESLIQIAIQCPSAGGPAVFAARNLIKLINDSIEYDDASTCMQQGILRVANQFHNGIPSFDCILQPNPASNLVQVVMDEHEVKSYLIKLINCLGQEVLRKEFTGIINTMQFSVAALHQGLYTVVITESNGRQMFKKLVIEK